MRAHLRDEDGRAISQNGGIKLFKTKKARTRVLAVVFVVAILCSVMASTAYATTYNDTFWFQSTGKKIITLGNMGPVSGINFYAIATSSGEGTFDVVLQREGILGIWFSVSSTRTGYQSSNRLFDTRGNKYVYGSPFLCQWDTTQSGNYRVILENPTNPQQTELSGIEAWTFG